MPQTKICKKCLQEKDSTLFRPQRNSCRACDVAYTMAYDRLHDTEERRAQKHARAHAYAAQHRAEAIARAKAWSAAHPEQVKQTSHAYYLAHKEDWKTRAIANKDHINARARVLRTLPKNKARKRQQDNAYREKHAAAVQAQLKRYAETHRESMRARVKAWRKAHPEERRNQDLLRKARQQGASRVTLSHAQWREIKEAFDHRCAYCGRKMQRLTRDHITPTVEKGDHHIHNIVPACQSCNSRKGIGPPLTPVQPLLLTLAPEHKKKKVS